MFTIERVTSRSDLDLCAEIRAEVYGKERGIIPASKIVDGLEYDKYDEGKTVHLLARSGGQPAGTFRIVMQNGRPLPVSVHFGIEPWPDRMSAELSRFAILKPFRKGLLMIAMCRAMYDQLLQLGIDDSYAIIEPGMHRALTLMGFPFQIIGDPMLLPDDTHKTVPTILRTKEVLSGLAARRPQLAGLFGRPFTGTITEGDLTEWTSLATSA